MYICTQNIGVCVHIYIYNMDIYNIYTHIQRYRSWENREAVQGMEIWDGGFRLSAFGRDFGLGAEAWMCLEDAGKLFASKTM